MQQSRRILFRSIEINGGTFVLGEKLGEGGNVGYHSYFYTTEAFLREG